MTTIFTFRAERRSGGDPLPTAEEAAKAGRIGWNLRCNRCGMYGARWIPEQRPGWGSLALCDPHGDELEAEFRRHQKALTELRAINFEQENR
ncbi:hypothetical protein [Amycolatopsis pigmentata]|uniref:Uncharacterized protein n=1 Tax=Amycolatopsis pigmentata TaxID=450801 RepID=A0ABW5G7D8_9PSEU